MVRRRKKEYEYREKECYTFLFNCRLGGTVYQSYFWLVNVREPKCYHAPSPVTVTMREKGCSVLLRAQCFIHDSSSPFSHRMNHSAAAKHCVYQVTGPKAAPRAARTRMNGEGGRERYVGQEVLHKLLLLFIIGLNSLSLLPLRSVRMHGAGHTVHALSRSQDERSTSNYQYIFSSFNLLTRLKLRKHSVYRSWPCGLAKLHEAPASHPLQVSPSVLPAEGTMPARKTVLHTLLLVLPTGLHDDHGGSYFGSVWAPNSELPSPTEVHKQPQVTARCIFFHLS